MDASIKNAVITNTFLGFVDNGIFTALLSLNYGGSEQSFGNHDLHWKSYGIEYISRILKVLGVGSWEELSGVHCRVEATHDHVVAIGHILKDQWFSPEEDLKGNYIVNSLGEKE